MKLSAALLETVLRHAVVVAGRRALEQDIAWVHIIDHSEVAEWVRPGQLLLSNGYTWPESAQAQHDLVQALVQRGLVGVVLSVPHFMTHFPPETVAAAEHFGLPLLEIPWEINFAQVTEEILTHILARQARVIERSDKVHRELTAVALNATALGDIADALASLLCRTVEFSDAYGVSICSAGDAMRQTALRQAMAGWIDCDRALRSLDQSHTAMRFGKAEDSGLPGGLACGIHIRGELAGAVWISDEGAALGELDARAVEHAAVVAALYLSHQRAMSQQETQLGYAFVDALLEGRFVTSASSLERARMSGWSPDGEYRVCIALLDVPVPLSKDGYQRRERWADDLRRHLRDRGLSPLLTLTLNRVNVLLPASVRPEDIWRAVGDTRSALAVSRVHRGADGMALAAEDAAGLLPMLRPGRVHHFDEMLFDRVLHGDAQARSVFLDRVVTPLRGQRRGESMLETLQVLAQEGFQLVQTAKRLGIHVSTLRYRVEKIEALLGRSLDDGCARLELQVAMRLAHQDEA